MYDVQLIKEKTTLPQINDCDTNNVCHSICQDSNQLVAKVAAAWLKLMSFC